jgi:hypothetical protein
MFVSQGGLCAICGKPESKKDKRTGKIKRLCVDHNHSTGQVRQLLCAQHNLAIGNIQEDPKIAIKLAEYLIQWSK